MKQIKYFLITVLCGLILSFIPPFSTLAQKVKDSTIINRVKDVESRSVALKKRTDNLTPIVENNKEKLQKVDSLLSAKKSTPPKIITQTKVVVKEKIVEKKVPVYIKSEHPIFISEGQYVERPIIIQPATQTYGAKEIKYMTYSEWRAATGEKSEKKYKKYLKEKGVLK